MQSPGVTQPQFRAHGKTGTWKTYITHSPLLMVVNSFAERGVTDLKDAEKEHVINIYCPTSNASSVDACSIVWMT